MMVTVVHDTIETVEHCPPLGRKQLSIDTCCPCNPQIILEHEKFPSRLGIIQHKIN
jgi:hypothetical protein